MGASGRQGLADYVLSERRFSGTDAEIVEQLDELIEALIGFRGWLVSRASTTQTTPRRRRARRRATMRVVVALLGLLAFAVAAFAQSSELAKPDRPECQPASAASDNAFDHIRFGVTLEGYYQYNWNRPYDRVNLLRAYDTRANSFSLQQAAIVVESAPKVDEGRRFGARLDLQFGQATETVQGNPANELRPDVYRHVWQAYGTYVFPIGRGLQLDFGKFASMLGYESNYAKDDQHFSRSYLFNFLPFYHAGLRTSLPVGDEVTLLYMLTNGIQQTEDFNDFKSNHFAAVVRPSGRVTWAVNYYFGQEQPDGGQPTGPDGFFRVFDTYVSYTPTPKLGLALDVNYVSTEVNASDPARSLRGTGAYARYQVTPPVAVAMRYERLDDEGVFGGLDQVLSELTATGEYRFADGFLVRGEFRRDWSDQPYFTGPEPDDLRRHQQTFLVGLVWWLGNKKGAW